jgi:hypothetical protein
MISDFIFEIEDSLSKELCDDIIMKYDLEEYNIFEGSTVGGVNKKVKDTTDLSIPKNDIVWYQIENTLKKELEKGIKKYFSHLNKKFDYDYKSGSQLHVMDFMIQKYDKQKGKYTFHHDFCTKKHNSVRTVTFIWYLNDVDIGGETEFVPNIKIKPKKGKLVFFPASWCWPHRGIMPISSDKYIITNWFWEENDYVDH